MKFTTKPKEQEAFKWDNNIEDLKAWMLANGSELKLHLIIPEKGSTDSVCIIEYSPFDDTTWSRALNHMQYILFDGSTYMLDLNPNTFLDRYTEGMIENVSDGYHTFKELYDHRIALWIALCKAIHHDPEQRDLLIWKSLLHSDASSFAGWFVLGITNNFTGEILTYHLPEYKWEACEFAFELERGQYDGHTSADVLNRLYKL